MSTTNKRTLGQSQNTHVAVTSAMRFAVAYRKRKQLPTEVKEAEIVGDNIVDYMSAFCCWAAVTSIPKYFDENLQPTRNNNNNNNVPCCTTDTIIGYIGQHYWAIRAAFPQHPEWINLGTTDHPAWWTNLRTAFITESSRYQMFDAGDNNVFGGYKTKPLYPNLGGGNADDISSQCDLMYVLRNLLKTAKVGNNNMELSLQILLTFDSIARGGEVKFQDFTDWGWDYLLNVTDTTWSESKTINSYAMARVPDENPLFDFYWQLGAYAMCETGLFRSEEQIANNLMNKAFPNLYAITNNSVTGKITDGIRANLPPGLPEAERKQLSAKSLRQAAITTMSMHKLINIYTANARIGHSTGTSNDSYLDKTNPARGLPAAHALHGRVDLFAAVVVPRLNEALGPAREEMALTLVAAMFPSVNVPGFKVGGPLWIVLKTAAASLLRHYAKAKKIASNNRVCDMMEKAAVRAQIKDDMFPGISPKEVLAEWCRIITQDYEERLRIADVAAKGASDPMTASLHGVIAQMASDIKELKEDKRDSMLELASNKSIISQQERELHSLRVESVKLQRQLALFKTAASNAEFTPQKQAHHRPPFRRQESATLASPPSAESDRPAVAAAAASNPPAEEETPAAGGSEETRYPTELQYGHDAQVASEKNGQGNKGERVFGIFLALATDGKITQSDLTKVGKDDIPMQYKRNRQLVINCLEMTELALEGKGKEGRSDIETLVQSDAQSLEATNAALRLETACCNKLFECEETTAELNPKKKKTMTGVGTRIKTYKQKIHDAKEKLKLQHAKKPCDEKLIDIKELKRLEKDSRPSIHSAFDKFPRKKQKTANTEV